MRQILTTTALALLTAPALHAQSVTEDLKLQANGTPTTGFGSSVALSGGTVVVGASSFSDGAAYSFDLGTGTQLQEFVASDGTSLAAFGTAVGIDGSNLFVGADQRNTVYRFNLSSGAQTGVLTGNSPDALGSALGVDNNRVVTTARFEGTLSVFDGPSGALLAEGSRSEGFPADGFGGTNATALSGSLALVGAPLNDRSGIQNRGTAYVFDIPSGQQITQLSPVDFNTNDGFGSAVALEGTTALVGAAGDDTSAGSAYVFDLTTFSQRRKLTASDRTDQDSFGNAVALDGDLAVIGADFKNGGRGAAYLFNIQTGEELAKLTASDAAENAGFGSAIAMEGAKIVVGADGAGAAYVFDLTPTWQGVFGGDYDAAANWGVLTPGSAGGLDVVIRPDTTQIVTGPAGISEIASLTLGGGAGTVTLDLQQGGGIVSEGIVRVDAGGVLTGDGGVIAPFIRNEGTIDLQPGLGLNAQVINEGMVQGQGTVGGTFVNDRGAQTIGGSGQQITFAGEVDNFGTIGGSNTTMRFQQGLQNRSDSMMQFSGGFTSLFGDIENGPFASIVNSGNGTLTMFGPVRNEGEIRTSGGGSTVFFDDYFGPGSLTGGGDVFFEGDVSTGASPGLMNFSADIFLTNADTTLMEIAGLARGTDYDAWNINGALDLGGTLDLVSYLGFAPQAGDSFELFRATDGITGTFSSVNLMSLDNGLAWREGRTTNSLSYSVVAPVPLPAGAWMLLAGLGALAWRSRRRGAR